MDKKDNQKFVMRISGELRGVIWVVLCLNSIPLLHMVSALMSYPQAQADFSAVSAGRGSWFGMRMIEGAVLFLVSLGALSSKLVFVYLFVPLAVYNLISDVHYLFFVTAKNAFAMIGLATYAFALYFSLRDIFRYHEKLRVL